MIKVLLIDADIITYRAGFSAQKMHSVATSCFTGQEVTDESLGTTPTRAELTKYLIEKGENLSHYEFKDTLLIQPEGYARYAAKLMIEQLRSKEYWSNPHLKLFLTSADKSNYRYKVATLKPYKGNRVAPKPVHYDAIRRYLTDVWGAKIIRNEEADDRLGQLQTYYTKKHGDNVSCIVSIDKDLNSVPGYHYNFVKDQLYLVDEFGSLTLDKLPKTARKVLNGTGLKWFYAQMLLGDNADNIPGLKQIGSVKVFNLLNECKTEQELRDVVFKEYLHYYKEDGVKAFNEVGNLLWIRQYNREGFIEEINNVV